MSEENLGTQLRRLGEPERQSGRCFEKRKSHATTGVRTLALPSRSESVLQRNAYNLSNIGLNIYLFIAILSAEFSASVNLLL